MTTSVGQPNVVAILFFFVFVAVTLAITCWAARRTKSTEHFYAAGRSVTGLQNGLALAGDYMSAASFLGIAGLVALSGFDGLIYSIGFLVGWPVVMFLIAEPLRNLGRYTFADVVAYRLRQAPVRIAAAIGTLAVVTFYLIAQMVGAGNLIKLLFGLPYETAIVIVGVVMMAYVLFGGMIATTWVQIVKAVLLLSGAFLLAALVLVRFGINPLALFATAAERYGARVLAPGQLVSDPLDAISLGLALMFGTAGLPHILMRFYTVPDARTARSSVSYATGVHRLLLPAHLRARLRRDGDRGPGRDPRRRQGRQHGRAAAGRGGRRHGLPRLHRRRRLRHDPRGGRRAHALGRGRALARSVGQRRAPRRGARARAAPCRARRRVVLGGIVSVALGIVFKGQNVAYMVGLAFAIAASANFPALVLSIFWRPLHHARARRPA